MKKNIHKIIGYIIVLGLASIYAISPFLIADDEELLKDTLKSVPKYIDESSREFIDHLIDGDIEGMKSYLHEEFLKMDNITQILNRVVKLLDGDIKETDWYLNTLPPSYEPFKHTIKEQILSINNKKPKSIKPIGYKGSTFVQESDTRGEHTLVYELEFEDAWVTIDVVNYIENLKKSIIRFKIIFHPHARSILEDNKLTLSGKSLKHYLFFIGVVFVFTFIVVTALICVSSDYKRKWLWTLFILFGFWKLYINWMTGVISFNPQPLLFASDDVSFIRFPIFDMTLMGIGYFRDSLYGAWIIHVSLPLGAILFHIKKARGKLVTKEPVQDELSSDSKEDCQLEDTYQKEPE